MTRHFSTALNRSTLVAALAVCAACALHPNSGVRRHTAPLASDGEDGTVMPDSAAVELREYSFSPHVEIVSWTTDDADVGLRATLRRDGSLVRDHRLFVSTHSSVAAGSRFHLAFSSTRQLKLTGVARDSKNCAGGSSCLPFETFGARIPDKVLRSSRDSLPVRFLARDGHEVQVTLHRDLISAYLASVDSLSSALKLKSRR